MFYLEYFSLDAADCCCLNPQRTSFGSGENWPIPSKNRPLRPTANSCQSFPCFIPAHGISYSPENSLSAIQYIAHSSRYHQLHVLQPSLIPIIPIWCLSVPGLSANNKAASADDICDANPLYYHPSHHVVKSRNVPTSCTPSVGILDSRRRSQTGTSPSCLFFNCMARQGQIDSPRVANWSVATIRGERGS